MPKEQSPRKEPQNLGNPERQAKLEELERWKEEEAIEEAIKLQNLLYGWYSSILRSHEIFPKEEYDSATVIRSQVFDQVKDKLKLYDSLPGTWEKEQIFKNLHGLIPNKLFIFVWSELLMEEASQSEEYKKFCRFSGPLFSEAEKYYKPLNYYLGKNEFLFNPPSRHQVLLFELFKKIGNLEYQNETELLEKYKKALQGKRILEVGPGPGWLLLTLKHLGGEVFGIEQNQQYKFVSDCLKLDVRFGDAKDIDSIFKEKFDIIVSYNVFCHSVLGDKQHALRILEKLRDQLNPGGISVHTIEYIKQPKEYCFLQMEDFLGSAMTGHARNLFENASLEEQEQFLRQNIPSVREGDIASLGLKGVEYKEEAGQLVFAFAK